MRESSRRHGDVEPLPAIAAGGCGRSAVAKAAAKLARHKLRLRLSQGPKGVTAGGVALRVSVGKVLRSPDAAERLMRRVIALLHESVPLTLSLVDLGGDVEATDSLQAFCTTLRRSLAGQGLPTEPVGISLQSHVLPLQAYLLICTAILGHGPRYVLLDSLQMKHHEDARARREADANWTFLWRTRSAAPGKVWAAMIPAYAASVTTRCPLLGDEAATAILPAQGLQAPVASAWLPLELDLMDFSDGHGRLRWPALQDALERAVDEGDEILDQLHWPLPEQRSDAWQNRRLAVTVDGVGDLVMQRGADPGNLRCLQWIDSTVARIHEVLWQRSRLRAGATEPLPALLAACPSVRWNCDIKKSDWDSRWRSAVASSAVRHRNLLVMSPYSVLPSRAASVANFIDLLPVLRHADAFSFSQPRVRGFRSCDEFANFHRRAWAVMQRRNAASLVAAGV
ncbi:MAG: hypothetical protein WD448_11070 [Woeseia sp.]